jgi:hypothetical protein
MLNLIRFRSMAEYHSDDPEYGQTPVSGEKAYRRYFREARALPVSAPGQWIWEGDPKAILIGPSSEYWHLAFVRHYFTIRSFVDMIKSPEYKRAARHRRAATLDSRLILNRPGIFTSTLKG